jgi:hypothetical protein
MPKKPISREHWDRLVAAFRLKPGKPAAVARQLGLDFRHCVRAWESGFSWADFPEARGPIKALVEGEHERQRVALVRQESTSEALRQDAQRDAAQTRVAEAQMMRLARVSATTLLASLTKLAVGAAQISDVLATNIQSLAQTKDKDGNPRPLTIQEVKSLVGLISRVGVTVRQITEAANKTLEGERLVNGEPTQILGVVHKVEDLSAEEADRRMGAALRALERAKSQGLFAPEAQPARMIEGTFEKAAKTG